MMSSLEVREGRRAQEEKQDVSISKLSSNAARQTRSEKKTPSSTGSP